MNTNSFVLGLDLGVASIGWALGDQTNAAIVASGVRIFEPAVDVASFQRGEQGSSHAVARRSARLQRRQLRRRAARQRDLYVTLSQAGLLPDAGPRAELRHEQLTTLDQELIRAWRGSMAADGVAAPEHVLCYYLRARALRQKLEPFDLGRALYHLGQRRGFLSNRREGRNDKDKVNAAERSQMKASIKSLEAELSGRNMTLGERMALTDPHVSTLRNRKRPDMPPVWTGRAMYQEEFARIWEAQQPYFPQLTPELRTRIDRLMFWQRPIAPGQPGACEFEAGATRAPKWTLLAQQFRMVQSVNNLKVKEPGTQERSLASDERSRLLAELRTAISTVRRKDRTSEIFGLTFDRVKELLGLGKRAKVNFDSDDGGNYLRGNRTEALMVRAFGQQQWSSFSAQQQRRIVRVWATEESRERMLAKAAEWGLPPDRAAQLAEALPEDGYAALSHAAMLKLLPRMQDDGLAYAVAVAQTYGSRLQNQEAFNFLPPVCPTEKKAVKGLGRVSNPAVMRALTELRKLVNAIIREYGKPERIRIELARDLKRNAEQRERIYETNRQRQRDREWAARVVSELNRRPSRDAIERVLLHRDCGGVCAYCGNSLGRGKGMYADLFDENAAIQVEHVLPRRWLDDSYSNKVLAHRACNERKGDRTPAQAFGQGEGWEQMLTRVESMNDGGRLERFKIADEAALQDFSNRHLADTRYISKSAARYVEHLYGGRDAAAEWHDRVRRRVFASSGGLTALLRRAWGLEAILREPEAARNGQGGKSRTDHRHHAIDAIVIALTGEAMVQQAARAVEQHDRSTGYNLPRYFPPPWPATGDLEDRIVAFRASIEREIKTINVSHRPQRKLQGSLHAETNYSAEKKFKSKNYVHVRNPVHELARKDIESDDVIVDVMARDAIRAKLQEVGEPKKLETNLPLYPNGRPIRAVRVRVVKSAVIPLRHGTVAQSNNHHLSVVAELDDAGREVRWFAHITTLYDAMKRLSQERKNHGSSGPHHIIRSDFELVARRDPEHPRSTKRYVLPAEVAHHLESATGTSILRTANGQSRCKPLFYLMKGDLVEFDREGRKEIWRVSKFSREGTGRLGLIKATDSRVAEEAYWRPMIDELRKLSCRKVEVDLIGRILPRAGSSPMQLSASAD